MKGKPGYLAPEQAAGEEIDGRVDLFALGVTLWECLAGQQLMDGADTDAMMRAAFEKVIVPPAQLRADVPPELSALVMTLLERSLSLRTPSAAVALQTLRALRAQFPHGASELAQAVDDALRTSLPSGALPKASPAEVPTQPSSPARRP